MTWECDDCGSTSRAPPCDACGSESGAYERFVWACTECDKQQSRHNPPCGRCGSMQFEKRPHDYQDIDDELAGPSYVELAKPALPVLGVLALVGALVLSGVVAVPAPLTNAMQGPHVSNAPGHAEEANGLDLAAVEDAVHEGVNERLTERGGSTLARDSTLDDLATFENRRRVVGSYEGGSVHGTTDEFAPDCQRRVNLLLSSSTSEGILAATIEDFDTERELADAVVSNVGRDPSTWSAVENSQYGYGVDVHVAPDGTIWVVHAVC
ncbi:hypothetical protein [Haloarchaeobius sp. HRN-SO-5]|uniref:hypothetical protein n=1 Tax=Haloarchaeobius sp. HRN-SO-5 TaxID=3446118 RepID=UPI003EBE367E